MCILRRQPGPRGDDQRFHARFQGRMNHRREMRVVVRRQVVEPARFFGLRIDIGVRATDEPEDGRDVPLGPEAAEVLARGRRAGFQYPLGGESAVGTRRRPDCSPRSRSLREA